MYLGLHCKARLEPLACCEDSLGNDCNGPVAKSVEAVKILFNVHCAAYSLNFTLYIVHFTGTPDNDRSST